jgi:hypothetical protein
MISTRRVAAVLAICAAFATAGPVTASGSRVATADAALASVAAPTATTSSPAPCSDSKYNLQGVHWSSTLRWSFKSSTTPSYLSSSAVLTVLRRSFTNITTEHNDCGRSDHVSATQSYLGTTTHAIGVNRYGHCGTSDGANTVGFGVLPSGVLAITCVRSVGTRIVETDIRISNQLTWALSLSNCSNDFMLESVVTHEVGHAFGLAHVGELNHGRLTMSTYIDGTCENQEATLGYGDMRGLEVYY